MHCNLDIILKATDIRTRICKKQTQKPQTVDPIQQKEYRYSGEDQRIVIPTLCRAIDKLVETCMLLLQPFVGLSTD